MMLTLSSIRRPRGLLTQPYDLAIYASGYETRARSVADTVAGGALKSVVFGFAEHPDHPERLKNDLAFSRLHSTMLKVPGSDDDEADAAVAAALDMMESRTARLLVDISSMTRCWYGAIIRALANQSSRDRLSVTFSYTPGGYSRAPTARPLNRFVGPVRGFAGLDVPEHRKTVSIVGLGYERGRAMGVLTEIDPTVSLFYYAHPGTDERFVDDVMQANADLARAFDSSTWRTYPLNDPFMTFHIVDSACNAIGRGAHVVLTNNGPKLFGLIGFLVSARHPEVSVWRISSGSSGPLENVVPAGAPHLLETIWTSVGEPATSYAAERYADTDWLAV